MICPQRGKKGKKERGKKKKQKKKKKKDILKELPNISTAKLKDDDLEVIFEV